MVVSVRPMTSDDDLAVLTESSALGWMAHWWRAMDDPQLHWFVGEVDGEPSGYACCIARPIAADGRAAGAVHVVPHRRRSGLGTLLGRAVVEAARSDPSSPDAFPGVLFSYVAGEDDAEAAVAAWGLPELARHHESCLDLTTLDRGAYAKHAAAPGVELQALKSTTMSEQDWIDLHAFVQARFREAPDAGDGGGEMPIELLRDTVTDPWSLVTATEEGQRLGITLVLRRPGADAVVNTFFTGVAPTARGRGLALALKSHQALLMADAGIRTIFTQNMVGNEPILAANRRLGFVPGMVTVDVTLDL